MSDIKDFKYILSTICLCVIFVIGFVYICCTSCAQVTTLDISEENRLDFFEDGTGGIITLESSGGTLTIMKSKRPQDKVTVPYEYDFAKKVGKNIYLFAKSVDDDKTTLRCYSITKNEISSPVDYGVMVGAQENVAILKNSRVFVLSSFNSRNIFSFYYNKSKITGHAMMEDVKSIKNNFSATAIYLQTHSDKSNVLVCDKTISTKDVVKLSMTMKKLCLHCPILCHLTKIQNRFSRDTNSKYDFEELKQVSIEKEETIKCLCSNYIVVARPKSRTIRLIDISNVDRTIEYECSGDVRYLSAYKENLLIVEQNDKDFCLKEMDIESISDKEEKTVVPKLRMSLNSKARDADTETEQEVTIEKEVGPGINIDSKFYTIDYDRKVIMNVDLNTSALKFKKNISTSSNKVQVIKNNKPLVSGRVGTGTKVQLTNPNGDKEVFTLIVKGDITGSGSISKLDIRALYNHIFKNRLLENIQLEAADINNDGVVDTLDLLSISKMQQ